MSTSTISSRLIHLSAEQISRGLELVAAGTPAKAMPFPLREALALHALFLSLSA